MVLSLLQAAVAISAPSSMNAELIKAVAFWLAVILAAPMTFACVRAAMFFGSLKTTVDQLGSSMKAFTEWAAEHGNRLTAVEVKVDGMERRNEHVPGRRHGDS